MIVEENDSSSLVVHRSTRRSKRDKMASPNVSHRSNNNNNTATTTLSIDRDEFFHDDDDDDNLTIGTEWFTKSTITNGGHPSDEFLPLEGEEEEGDRRSPSSSSNVPSYHHYHDLHRTHETERREPHSFGEAHRRVTSSRVHSDTTDGKDSSELVVEELMTELDNTKEQLSLALANNAKKACRIHELEQEMETLHTKWKSSSKQRNDLVEKLQTTLSQLQDENVKLKYENRALKGRMGHMMVASGGGSPSSVGASSGGTNGSSSKGGYPRSSTPSAYSAHGRLQVGRNDHERMFMMTSASAASMDDVKYFYRTSRSSGSSSWSMDDAKKNHRTPSRPGLSSVYSPSSFTYERGEDSDSMSAPLKLMKPKKNHKYSPSKLLPSSPAYSNERGILPDRMVAHHGLGGGGGGAAVSNCHSSSRRPMWRKVLSKHKKKEEVRPLLSTTQKLERKEAQKLASMGCFPDYWQCLPHVQK